MKRFTFLALRFTRPAASIMCLVVAAVLPADAATPILPINDVKPGMIGECRTVFSGTKIETFRFRVEGIGWDHIGPGRHTIWCRMLNDPTGGMVIAAGMSGSPCTVDGKLMGALAYGWEFNKDAKFGVQPIESMLEVQKDYGQVFKRRGARPGAKRSSGAENWSLTSLKNPLAAIFRPRLETEIPILIQLGRLHPLVAERILGDWRQAGLFPLQGNSGSARGKIKAELVPGAAAAGVLAKGDFTAAATGTLTWREGDKIMAFGHAFTNRGEVEIPLASSEIISVVSSYDRSFKMANLGEIVGTINKDRMSAVAGMLGPRPAMVPMTVRVRYPKDSKEYHLEFINDRGFAPLIYLTALTDFLAETMEQSSEATVRVRGRIEVKGFPEVKIDRLFSGENFGWLYDLVLDSNQEINALYNNEVQDFEIQSVELDVSVEPVYRTFTIEQVDAYPTEIKPGGTVEGWVTLRCPREPAKTIPFKLKIPEEVKSGDLEIQVLDAKNADRIEDRSLGFSPIPPATGGELIGILNDRHEPGRLYFYVVQKAPGLILQNERLPSLPGSIRQQLDDDQSRTDIKPIQNALILKESKDAGAKVQGSGKIKIKIQS